MIFIVFALGATFALGMSLTIVVVLSLISYSETLVRTPKALVALAQTPKVLPPRYVLVY